MKVVHFYIIWLWYNAFEHVELLFFFFKQHSIIYVYSMIGSYKMQMCTTFLQQNQCANGHYYVITRDGN